MPAVLPQYLNAEGKSVIFPLLSVFCSLIIANYLRLLKDQTGRSMLSIFLGNYLTASIFSLSLCRGSIDFSGLFELSLGIVTGILFLLNFLIYKKNIQLNSLSLSVAVMRTSVIIPILASLFVFSEIISIFNLLGIILIIFSFTQNDKKSSIVNKKWLLTMFLLTGITDTGLKVFDVHGSISESLFLFFVFSSAFLANLFLVMITGSFSLRFFIYGLLLGIPNQLSSLFFLISLTYYQAAIVYPLVASLMVVFSLLSDRFIWRRPFSRRQKVFFSLMIIGIIMLNIKPG